MKKIIMAVAFLGIATMSTFAQTTQDSTHKKHHSGMVTKKYTCSMHPEVVSDKPGKCPKCGMELIVMKKKTGKKQKPMKDIKM